MSVCLPEIEKWADAYYTGSVPAVSDGAGYRISLLEGVLRPYWGLAPIINEYDPVIHVGGKAVSAARFASDFLSDIVDPGSPHFLGLHCCGHQMYFQSLTELAGLLVCMFFAREKMWDPIPDDKKRMIADFILDGCALESDSPAENNHLWFPVLSMTVLAKLGFTRDRCDGDIRAALGRLDTMYREDGWYSDGPDGRYDYYSAWSMHSYPLLWCLIEDGSFAGYAELRDKYVSRTGRFLKDYVSFFAPDGSHVPYGRSLAYRFAASCVFPLAVMAGCGTSPALAKSVTVANITFFAENMAADGGIIPAGYLYPAPALVESYTSGGGSYWCAKSFLALLMGEDHPFWSSDPVGIPQDDVRPGCTGLALMHDGTGVTLYNNGSSYYQFGRYCNPFLDMAGYYCKFAYNSAAAFALSSRDCVSADGMISLIVPDESMASHRYGFRVLPPLGDIMVSEHAPFANDSGTKIKTYLLPLGGSVHLRIHSVVLSQPYKVVEGGYSLPLYSDCLEKTLDGGAFSLMSGRLVSSVRAVGTAFMSYRERQSQPGMHLYAPRSVYPSWYTNVLAPGRYIFASVFALSLSGDAVSLPDVAIDGDTVTVGDRVITVDE